MNVRNFIAIGFLTGILVTHSAQAHGNAVLGSAIGAAVGTAIGQNAGGRDGAVIGGALGGAVGASVGHDLDRSHHDDFERRSDNDYGYYEPRWEGRHHHHHHHHYEERVVVVMPRHRGWGHLKWHKHRNKYYAYER